jgi:hypothetical protein
MATIFQGRFLNPSPLFMHLCYWTCRTTVFLATLSQILASCRYLQIIDFSSNEFSGEIPTNFSQGTRILSLGKNHFSGRLSGNLSYMSKLEYLDIHDNKITGELPHSICQISTLQILNLQNNSLQGSIPDCISNLTSLRILDLSSNHLVGEIPAKFRNLAGMIETPDGFSYLLVLIAWFDL